MLYSMTGYGKAETVLDDVRYEIEIKSVNGKNFDVQIRLPQWFRHKEIDLRKRIQQRLLRGKIGLTISWETLSDKPSSQIRNGVLQAYWEQIRASFPDIDKAPVVAALLRQNDVWQQEENEDNDALWNRLEPYVEKAMDELIRFRRQEGEEIKRNMLSKIDQIRAGLDEIVRIAPSRIEKIRERLEKSVAEIKESVDEQRMEQEILFYLDKLDINEEISRLSNHIRYFLQTLDSDELSKGKKLNFIAQEMGREINTIGSKANFDAIQHSVVRMKDALEQIKEQTYNIL